MFSRKLGNRTNPWIAALLGVVVLPGRDTEARRRTLLKHAVRRDILGILQREPGIKISDLCKQTGAGWGTIQHHLNLLKKAHLVVSRSPGRDCLLFSSDYPADRLPVAETLRRGRAERLAIAIARSPGASQKELCDQVNMTRKIIRRYVGLLSSAGLVSERREARFQRYYPNPRLVNHLRLGTTDALEEAPALR